MNSMSSHALFLTDTGSVYSSGIAAEGELGYMAKAGRSHPPTKIDLPFKVSTGAVGNKRSAVVSESGELFFFGKVDALT